MEHDAGATQVRWLIAGAFGLGERGKTIRLTRADFNEVFAARKITVTATVTDAIGAGDTRSFELGASSLKELTLKHVMRSVPELGEIAAMADKVAKLKDPTVESVGEIVGEGKLLDAARALLSPDDAPTAGGDAGSTTGDAEAIFDKAEVAKPTAKSAIDMFIRASSSSSKKKSRPAARQLRDLVEEVAWGMAKDVLAADAVRAVEESWRGVRFLVMECPKDAAMEVCLLETDPEHVLEDLENRTRGDEVEEPDCIFIPHDYTTTEGLAELADHAEGNLIPIVVGADPTLFGAGEPFEVPEAFEAIERANNDEVPGWATAWDELRMLEPTRWLTAVTNRVVLHAEGKGAAERVVFGSGVWAVAAMLARSYRSTGGFAKILDAAAAVRRRIRDARRRLIDLGLTRLRWILADLEPNELVIVLPDP